MPGHDFASLRDELVAAGCAPDMPAAIVSRASAPDQRYRFTIVGELAKLPRMDSPAVLLIGRSLDRAHRRSSAEAALALDEAELILTSSTRSRSIASALSGFAGASLSFYLRPNEVRVRFVLDSIM